MKKFLKILLGIIIIFLCLAVGICVLNSKTDFFQNIGSYIPALEENFPEAAEKISELSDELSELTHKIPSIREIADAITGNNLPIDPEDVATNAYIKDSPMLTFYPDENISMQMLDGGTISIFGVVGSIERSNLIVCFDTPDGETLEQNAVPTDSAYRFNEQLSVPQTDCSELYISVYTGSKPYGNFISWVYNYVVIEKTDSGEWEIKTSPVYESNVEKYERDKSISDALKSTDSVQSDYANMISLAEQLTADCSSDYEKALVLHDWVASRLYYDNDSLSSTETAPYAAVEVMSSRRAVCLGYATLYATLCRAVNIPCNIVSGYALGVAAGYTEWTEDNIDTAEQNHVWNEVYLDGRWVITDVTWDSQNKYENGEFIDGGEVSHLYFDANLEYFSANHKIVVYDTKR